MKAVQIITRMIVGGAQRIALETACALRARGDDCAIWCGAQTGPEGSLAGEARAQGVPVTIVPDLVRQVDPVRDLRAHRWLLGAIREGRFDVVHTHSSKAGIVGRRAAHDARRGDGPRHPRAIVHTVHGWGWSERTPAPARELFVALERSAFGWADAVIAVSETVRDEGIRRGIGGSQAARYRVIRPGIDTARFADLDPSAAAASRSRLRDALGIPNDAIVAGTVGRLSSQKNPLALLDLAATIPELRLLFVGDGPLRGDMEREIARRGLAERVHLAGLRADVPDCLAALDLFVLPSLWEGLPLTILEARCAGIPVIATDVGGVREAMADPPAGSIVPPRDREALAGAVREWMGKRSEAREAAMAERHGLLSSASRERMLEETLALYDTLTGSGGVRG